METSGKNTQHLSHPAYAPQQLVLVWVAGMMLCMLVGLLALKLGLSHSEEDFHEKADLVYDEITRRYSTLEAVLTSLAGFHQASDHVSEVQFSTFAHELLNAYPYIRSAISLHALDHAGRNVFEEEMRDRGYYQFSVTEIAWDGSRISADNRAEYLVIKIIEPLLPHMGTQLGYDVLSDPRLTDAVHKASRSGAGVASFVNDLLQEGESIMVFKAVYQGRYAPTSEAERLEMFNGAIVVETSAENLLSGITPDNKHMTVALGHDRVSEDKQLQYTFDRDNRQERSPFFPLLQYERNIDLYGQPTVLTIAQQIGLADIHYYWILLTVFSCLIIYVSMLSTWHNLKVARAHEQELEGYAARAAFSEENTDPIMRIDHTGKLLYSNEPGQKIVNSWNTSTGNHVPDDIKNFLADVLQNNQYQEMETSIGSTHFTLRFIPRRAQNYVNVYGRDDTEQKQGELALLEAKQAAEAANIAKSRFLATISHEVRTPMNGVLGMLELLRKTQLNEKQRGYADNALRSGKNLLGLINDILDFSKIESNKLKLESVPFDIQNTIDEVLHIVAGEARKKNLELITEIPDISHLLIGDEQRLRQILINLIGNAVKFTEKGHVIVRLNKTAEYKTGIQLRFEISDTGIGIRQDALPYIFNDFTQQDDSTTRRFGGTGLGLAITKQLVNMMGGEIYAQSKPGEGSSFWITLQFETQQREESIADNLIDYVAGQEEATEEEVMLNARILLAEDNAINQEVASAMLESAGCDVVAVEDGEQALKALQNSQFDLVLMDCQMPNMDGFKATRTLRQQNAKYSHLPVIALTADIQQGIVQQCRQAGMDDYLSKPFTHDALIDMVMKWLPRQSYKEA